MNTNVRAGPYPLRRRVALSQVSRIARQTMKIIASVENPPFENRSCEKTIQEVN